MKIDDAEKMKLHLHGFRIITREMSLGCVREWHPQAGWRPAGRHHRSSRTLNAEFAVMRLDPKTIAVSPERR